MDNTTPLAQDYILNDQNVWLKKNAGDFHYSDGDAVETRIGEMLASARDRSVASDELKALQRDWPTTYYFSANRASLLRPFEKTLLANARVLELGCGMGAITRYLGETAAEVYAVDGSARRGGIAAIRCADLQNTHIIIDDILSLPNSLGEFDVVTLIGVLEYARRFGGPGAEKEILRKARSFLKPDGVLLLAIENKLGLKYLGGVPEDHLNRRWIGFTNGYRENGVTTWSRKEMAALLEEAGFKSASQYLALPDYKLPKTIITPAGLDSTPDELNLEAIFTHSGRYFEPLPAFNMDEAWKSVTRAGLLPDLADSLCFAASPERDTAEVFETGELVSHYGDLSSLPKKYAKEVKIKKAGNDVVVERQKMSMVPDAETRDFYQVIVNEPYIRGELLINRIAKVVMRADWTVEELIRAFEPWTKALKEKANDDYFCDGQMLDYTPFNLVCTENGVRAFDQEWASHKPLPLVYLLYRGFSNTIMRMMPLQKSSRHDLKSFSQLFREFIKAQNLPENMPISLDYLWWQELKFMKFVKNNPNYTMPKDFELVYMP